MLDDGQRLVQRSEAELQTARRHAVLACEWLKGKPNALRDAHRLFVEPVPAGPAQLEVRCEVNRYAFVDGVFEIAVQLEFETRIQAPAAAVGLQGRALHGDRFGSPPPRR